jgi:hypothetical protein
MSQPNPHIIDLRETAPKPRTHRSPRRLIRDVVVNPAVTARAAQAAAQKAIAERPRVVTPHRRLNIVLEVLQYPLIAAAALGAAYSNAVGQWIILAYAIYVLARRRTSRLSFGIALFLLITIPFFQAIGQTGIAANTAIYTYELLVVGTIQAMVELRKTDISTN